MELKTLAILLLVVCVCVREANQLAIPKLEWQTQLLSDVCIYGNFHEYCTNRERDSLLRDSLICMAFPP